MGGNFHEKLKRSLEIIFVVLNFVAIQSRIRDNVIIMNCDLVHVVRSTVILHDRDGALQH